MNGSAAALRPCAGCGERPCRTTWGSWGSPTWLLDKPGKLTDAEYEAMRRHPQHTADILSRVGPFPALAVTASAHHERPDGRGYHAGLSGDAIPMMARVLAVADVCDALRASRPYRQGLAKEQTLDIMEREAGRDVDAECFAALRAVMDGWGGGDDNARRPHGSSTDSRRTTTRPRRPAGSA